MQLCDTCDGCDTLQRAAQGKSIFFFLQARAMQLVCNFVTRVTGVTPSKGRRRGNRVFFFSPQFGSAGVVPPSCARCLELARDGPRAPNHAGMVLIVRWVRQLLTRDASANANSHNTNVDTHSSHNGDRCRVLCLPLCRSAALLLSSLALSVDTPNTHTTDPSRSLTHALPPCATKSSLRSAKPEPPSGLRRACAHASLQL
jgi:hypothetical protein